MLTINRSSPNDSPTLLDSSLTITLDSPWIDGGASFGFSNEFGVHWAKVENGSWILLDRVERRLGKSTPLLWRMEPGVPTTRPLTDAELDAVRPIRDAEIDSTLSSHSLPPSLPLTPPPPPSAPGSPRRTDRPN
jgi:hypothetical protein